jgi:hypothetical protein
MTETEWLACGDPTAMLEFLRSKASDRKLRLFACACCRRSWRLSERAATTLELAERHADGLVTMEAVEANLELLAGEPDSHEGARGWSMEMSGLVCGRAYDGAWFSGMAAAFADGDAFGHKVVWPECSKYLRCLFGNPFPRLHPQRKRWLTAALRFVGLIAGNSRRRETSQPDATLATFAVDPSWLTSTVRSLASQMYESRDFGVMPILADALQDAGCDSAEVLDHCRGPGPHVRGCWVVDLVLGKA